MTKTITISMTAATIAHALTISSENIVATAADGATAGLIVLNKTFEKESGAVMFWIASKTVTKETHERIVATVIEIVLTEFEQRANLHEFLQASTTTQAEEFLSKTGAIVDTPALKLAATMSDTRAQHVRETAPKAAQWIQDNPGQGAPPFQ